MRTYVNPGSNSGLGTPAEDAGVWFFSLDAASRLAVWGARTFWHLNYIHARMSMEAGPDGEIQYAVQRVKTPEIRMRCAWIPGRPCAESRPGDLAHFLTERYALYSTDAAGRCHRGRIWHEPWRLREAVVRTLEENLTAAAGLDVGPSAPPIVAHADAIDVEAWGLEKI